ncbi:hypothetical protein FOA52_014731 [Chlamydomonas sp. UWO 241]|nr:hypothetical protein FOA52_014731 [Chlamydomonas sp. UWO 241]
MSTLIEVEPSKVAELKARLQTDLQLPEKYQVLFSLRNVKGQDAQDALVEALKDPSALFRHDVCFCLGQRQDAAAVAVLSAKLRDTTEHSMVRHEAGEALGAIGTAACIAALMEHADDAVLEVAETCQLALQRMQYMKDHPDATNEESPYFSVDPTPALPTSTPTEELRASLLDENARMFDRYAALFALRNKGGPEAVKALGDVFGARSALLKHEVAYVLGQMQDPESTRYLVDVLADGREHAMVRHEAAEALGAIASDDTVVMLQRFACDDEPIVAHSCVVALDMLEHEKSGAAYFAGTAGHEA